jgi:hypothetical protein
MEETTTMIERFSYDIEESMPGFPETLCVKILDVVKMVMT